MFNVKFESFDIESSELCDIFTVFVSVPGFGQSFKEFIILGGKNFAISGGQSETGPNLLRDDLADLKGNKKSLSCQ